MSRKNNEATPTAISIAERIVAALTVPDASSDVGTNDPGLRLIPSDIKKLEGQLLKSCSLESLQKSTYFEADAAGGMRLLSGLTTPGKSVLVVRTGPSRPPVIIVEDFPGPPMYLANFCLYDQETRRRREASGGALIAVEHLAEAIAWRQLGLGAVIIPAVVSPERFWGSVDKALPADSRAVKKMEDAWDGILAFQKTESEISRDEKKKAAKPKSGLGTILLAPTFDPMTWEPATERAQRMARSLRSLVGTTVKRSVSIAVWAPDNLAVWEKKSPSLTMLQSSLRKDLRTVEWLLGESGPPPAQHPLDLVKLRRRLENCTERTPEHERRAAAAAYREQFQQSFAWEPPAGQSASVLDALTPTLLRQLAAADAELALSTNANDPRRREAAVGELNKIGNLLLRVEGQRKGGGYGTRRGR
ncbi:hypothetical protein [Lacipirellula limnantheis]|uniref:Uncharacterized protein n=1 Tax=Lacipirellula limnantheis TaxID=2528024 RepID=A0A517TZ97_9BACT|nr:hypothetical protein [Lacipirellula limnantheis]QDT73693.1 hypothetical protein I41_28830 [Lacipirellula limnantheis]